jgi:hypothetical protein
MITTARKIAARYFGHLAVCLLLGAAAAVGYDMAHTSPLHEAQERAAASRAAAAETTAAPVAHKFGRPIQLPPLGADAVSDCADGIAVYLDPNTGGLYGDQDGNGRLDHQDCDWT